MNKLRKVISIIAIVVVMNMLLSMSVSAKDTLMLNNDEGVYSELCIIREGKLYFPLRAVFPPKGEKVDNSKPVDYIEFQNKAPKERLAVKLGYNESYTPNASRILLSSGILERPVYESPYDTFDVYPYQSEFCVFEIVFPRSTGDSNEVCIESPNCRIISAELNEQDSQQLSSVKVYEFNDPIYVLNVDDSAVGRVFVSIDDLTSIQYNLFLEDDVAEVQDSYSVKALGDNN